MKMYETTQSVEKYLNVELECDCGRTHYAPVKAIDVRKGAINSLPEHVKSAGYTRPYIICDKITYEIAAKKCEELLTDAGYKVTTLIIKHMGFDEATLGEIVINKPDDCDLMIGVGTGSITDMLRYSSFKLGLPCFTVATGAPMDGFAASAGIMNVNNLKATMEAHNSEVIIGDTDILCGAPFRMTIAGFADLVAKVNALNDWRLDVLINGAHYCRKIDTLVNDYVEDILKQAEGLKNREPETIGAVMNALMLTGTSISLYGNSRPVSGAEHHMSHYWDSLGEQRGKLYGMHGEQVAVGTVMALMLAEELLTTDIDFDLAREKARAYDSSAWENEVRRVYGSAADAIISLEAKSGKNDTQGCLKRIDATEKNWETIRGMLSGLRSSSEMRDMFKMIGCPCDPVDLGVDAALLKDTILYAKETRARYTILQLAWDLGVLEEITDKVIARLEKMQAFG